MSRLEVFSLESSISTQLTADTSAVSSANPLRYPTRRPSLEVDVDDVNPDLDDNLSEPDLEMEVNEVGTRTVIRKGKKDLRLQAGAQISIRAALAVVAVEEEDGASNSLHATALQLSMNMSSLIRNGCKEEEIKIADDGDDGSACTSSSDTSDMTEVTNNKSITAFDIIADKDKREQAVCSSNKPLHDALSGLCLNVEDSINQAPLKPQQNKQPQDEQEETRMPFKGNPSIKKRREKERKTKDKKRLQNDDTDHDLRGKPGLIHVVTEEFEDGDDLRGVEDHGTSQSRKSRTTVGNSRTTSATGNNNTTGSCIHTNSSLFILTKERVRAHMKDYYEDYDSIFRYGKNSKACWQAFFEQYFTDDVRWVRSSGNPIGVDGLAQMLADDVVGVRMAMVSIDSIQVLAGDLAAVVVFTADRVFYYKGALQNDRTVITGVLHVANGCEILIGHEHHCAGTPIPKETRWES